MASDGTFFGLASLVDLTAQFSYILLLYAFSWLQKILFALFQQLLFEVKEFVSSFVFFLTQKFQYIFYQIMKQDTPCVQLARARTNDFSVVFFFQ